MRVCDRCGEPAKDEIIFKQEDQRYDVCPACKQILLEALIMKEKKKLGRPRKNSDNPVRLDA